MTEIEKTEGEIKVLQAKLELLKEMDNHKSPVEESYKRVYGHYPMIDKNDYYRWDGKIWFAFQKGYEEAQKDYKVGEPHYIDDPEYCSGIEWDEKDNPPEPTSTVFRQKIFDGIKSVFYDPEYERTHWKMKVNMAVDEVLIHFLEALPEPDEYIGDYGPSQEYVDGWNHYYEIIKEKLQGY